MPFTQIIIRSPALPALVIRDNLFMIKFIVHTLIKDHWTLTGLSLVGSKR